VQVRKLMNLTCLDNSKSVSFVLFNIHCNIFPLHFALNSIIGDFPFLESYHLIFFWV